MNNFRKARIAVFSSVHWNNSMVNISELYLEKYRLRWWKLTRKPNIYCLKYIATETKKYMHSAGISTGITCMSEKNFMLYLIQLADGILLKKAKIFWSYIKHFAISWMWQNVMKFFLGKDLRHRFVFRHRFD